MMMKINWYYFFLFHIPEIVLPYHSLTIGRRNDFYFSLSYLFTEDLVIINFFKGTKHVEYVETPPRVDLRKGFAKIRNM